MAGEAASGRRLPTRLIAALLFAMLLVGAVAALLVTRELRRGDDVVGPVKLTHRLTPGPEASARIRFKLTDGPQQASVEIVDADQAVVRTLVPEQALPAGRQDLLWDGRTDEGAIAPPGRYKVRILLLDRDRTVVTPDAIRIQPALEA